MPDPTSLALFLAAAVVLAVTPGPGLFYVAARSLAGGRADGVASSLGTGLGGMVHVLAGGLGVSALVLASAELFAALKLAGAAYLVWIGIRTVRAARRGDGLAPAPAGAPRADTVPAGSRRAFREGVLVEALNPKTAAFFLAFLPQFVDPAAGPVALPFVVLGSVSVALNTLADLAVAVAAGRLRQGAASCPGLISRLRPSLDRTDPVRFTGLSAFPITPADADGRVDLQGLRRLVARLCAGSVDSIGLLGSTGSYPYLTREERRRALDAALDEAAGQVPVLVGVGALRTDDAVRLAQDARAAGAAAGLLAAVSYTPLTDEEVFAHCETVARESGLPLCLYDNPSTTHFRFGPDLIGSLCRVPGIAAVKSPGQEPQAVAGHLAALRAAVPPGFSLGYSGDWTATEALVAGADAWYSVVAGLFPQRAVAIVRAVERGDAAEARRLDARLAPLWALFREHSSLRVMFACADLLGLCHAAPPRPILPLGEPARRRVAEVIRALDLG